MKTRNTITIAVLVLTVATQGFAGSPFDASSTRAFGNPFQNTPSVSGDWASGSDRFSITQNGSDLTLSFNGSQHEGKIFDNDITFMINMNGQRSIWMARLSADGQRIQARDPNSQFSLTRQNRQPVPPTNSKTVSLDSLRCVDLARDTILDAHNQDSITVKVYADGRLVDTITKGFTGADENGRAKSIGRQYTYVNLLRLEISESGRLIGNVDFDFYAAGTTTSTVATGLNPRLEWTQYEVTTSVVR